MRSLRGKGERRLDDALQALATALGSTGVEWMIIGGIAVIARGVRRLTTDIDAVVRGDAIGVAQLLRILARYGIRPRIDDAETFAEANLVLLLRQVETGVDIDLSLGWTAFEHEALAARSLARYGLGSFPMAEVEDLLVFKAMAARPKDLEDAASLMLMHPDVDLNRVRRRLLQLADMAGEPELVQGFELLLVRVRSLRPSRRRKAVGHPRPRRTTRKPSKTSGRKK